MTNNLRSRILIQILKRYADSVIAIDETVRRRLPSNIVVEIVHNGYSPEPLNRSEQKTDKTTVTVTSLPKETVRIGMVGNLLEMKGPYDFLEAARRCHEKKSKAVFLIVGDNVRTVRGIKSFMLRKLGFAQDLRAAIEERIRNYGMENCFHLLGFTADIQMIYEHIDVTSIARAAGPRSSPRSPAASPRGSGARPATTPCKGLTRLDGEA